MTDWSDQFPGDVGAFEWRVGRPCSDDQCGATIWTAGTTDVIASDVGYLAHSGGDYYVKVESFTPHVGWPYSAVQWRRAS